ncbi:MAG: pirin family protein [Nanoarchaeota archaeon]
MKIQVQKSEERGKADIGWLNSRFSFSFSNYYNPRRMGFGKLRVLNDDIIAPGTGFGAHSHDNMEIISIVLEGELEHKDNTGGGGVLKPGDIQVISAGSGVVHSEFNHSKKNKGKFLQIWIETKEEDFEPRYDSATFNFQQNELKEIVSGEKNKGTLYIHQNAKLSLGKFDKNNQTKYSLSKGNGVFIFVIEGKLEVEGERLGKRDSIEIAEIGSVNIKTLDNSYFMIIEVPMN